MEGKDLGTLSRGNSIKEFDSEKWQKDGPEMGYVIADGNYSAGGKRETDYLRRRGQNCWVISLHLPGNGISISHTSARFPLGKEPG